MKVLIVFRKNIDGLKDFYCENNSFSETILNKFYLIKIRSGLLLKRVISLGIFSSCHKFKRITYEIESILYHPNLFNIIWNYFINIKVEQVRTDFRSIDLTSGHFNNSGENGNQVSVETYDLNTESIIYSQKVIATILKPTDNHDVNFSQMSNTMLIKADEKLVKDLKFKSVL